MKRSYGLWIAAAVVAAALAAICVPATAQDAPGGATGLTGPAADANGDAPVDLLKQLTPEELEQLIRKADALRLADERRKTIDEIDSSGIYNEDDKTAAEALLQDKGAGTQQDNIDRITKAFAKAEPQFRRACQLMTDGKYKECAEAAKQLLKEDETGFNSAAKHFLYAEALAKLSADANKAGGEKAAKEVYFDAIEAYMEIPRLMPERLSFASASAIKAGKAYEDAFRFINAMKMYSFALRNYSITMTADQRDALLEKVKGWQDIFQDAPSVMKHLSGKMGEVQGRLAGADSGKETQEKERQIVQVLEDLIKTVEEAQQAQSQGQGKGQGKAKKPGEGEGEGQGQGQGQGQGKGQGKPNSTNNPSSPARSSFLPEGAAVRPGKLESPHTTKENNDWSELPPTDRDKLTESMKKMLSERYRDLVSDYTQALSKTEKAPK
jgi:tetratricopeptide (TPR) repeat protein